MPPRISREPVVHTSLFEYLLMGFGEIPLIGPLIKAITGIGGSKDLNLVTNYFNNLGTHVQQTNDNISVLQDKTQRLEGVIGYGHAYAAGGISTNVGERQYPMTNQIGPIVGVDFNSGRFWLNSKGLWVANCNAYFDFLNIGVTLVQIWIRVYAPNGSLFAERIAEADTGNEVSLSVHLPFVVPSSGYRVEMWVNAAVGRGIFGGQKYNGLDVTKVSTETS